MGLNTSTTLKSNTKASLERYIYNNFDKQVRFLSKIVQLASNNPPGDCAPHANFTADLLHQLGFKAERHIVPNNIVAKSGMKSIVNLIVREKFGKGGPVIALNAHGDAVAPGSGWTVDPYSAECIDGWMYGRGVAVSKSDFATFAFALKALKHVGSNLNGIVELHFTYDEETGGELGPQWILQQGLSRPDFAICPAFSYQVVIAQNGCLHLEIIVKGKSGHAAMPATGNDALRAANGLMQVLYEYGDSLLANPSNVNGIDHPSLVIGLISGGINTNVVPDRVTLRIDRRITPEEDIDEVENQLRSLINSSINTFTGISVEIKGVLRAKPLIPTMKSKHLASIICTEAESVLGEKVTTMGIPLYTDARLYAEAGIPTVMYGAGPRKITDANGHQADERLPLDTLHKATVVIANTLFEMLSG